MNRLLTQSLASAARSPAPRRFGAQASRTYATGPAAQQSSSNLATVLLGVGVVSAGGYYYLNKQSPQTIAKAENKLHELEGKASSALDAAKAKAGSVVSASGTTTGSDPSKGVLDPSKFVNLKLKAIEPYNHNTSRYVFEIPDNLESGLTVASALLMKPVVEGEGLDSKGKPAIRPYTPVTKPNDRGHMDFLIKTYPDGAFTQYLSNLKPGAEIGFKGPLPKHQWKANEFEHVGLVSGGTGITPMWQLMQAIDDNPADKTKVTLLFANVTEKDILLKESFDDLAKRKPDQFKVEYVIEKPQGSWKGEKGFINKETLAKYLPQPNKADKIKVFVCGPPPLMKAISGDKKSPKDQGPLIGALAEIGYTAEQVYKF